MFWNVEWSPVWHFLNPTWISLIAWLTLLIDVVVSKLAVPSSTDQLHWYAKQSFWRTTSKFRRSTDWITFVNSFVYKYFSSNGNNCKWSLLCRNISWTSMLEPPEDITVCLALAWAPTIALRYAFIGWVKFGLTMLYNLQWISWRQCEPHVVPWPRTIFLQTSQSSPYPQLLNQSTEAPDLNQKRWIIFYIWWPLYGYHRSL